MRVVVRADGSSSIGMGHVIRSLALATALIDEGAEVVCVGRNMVAGQKFASSFRHITVSDTETPADATGARQLMDFEPDGLVLDGYHFDPEFFDVFERAKMPYAVVDDNGETQSTKPAVVVNQNPQASKTLYPRLASSPLFLLGQNYALLRQEIRDLVAEPPKKSDFIVIALGGTDVKNFTIPVAKALHDSGYPIALSEEFHETFGHTRSPGGPDIDFFPVAHFSETLARARGAVLGAGSSLWEANALSVPTVGIIVADNQISPASLAHEQGYVAEIVNALDATSPSDLVDEVVKQAGRLWQRQDSRPRAMTPVGGVTTVARAILGAFRQSPPHPV